MLSDVVVAEVGDRLSTAWTGRILTDAGARVIRFEPPEPDRIRTADPDFAAFLHGGKESVATGGGLAETLAPLIAGIDVAVCDDPAAVAVLRDLRRLNPALVVVCTTDYGLTGPDADTPASDLTLQTEASFATQLATFTTPPLVCGLPLSELAGAIHTAIGVVQGLLARDAGGQDVEADVSRFEALLSLLTFPWDWAQVEGHTPYVVDAAGDWPYSPPMNSIPAILEAKDGWVCLSGNTPPQWTAIKEMMQVPGLADPRFDQVATRALYMDEVVPLLRSFTSRHTVAELIELCGQYRVPVAPVETPADAYTLPPYAERDSTVPGPDGRYRQPRAPFRFAGQTTAARPAPAIGEHDGLVLEPRTSLAPAVSAAASPARPLQGLRLVGFEVFHAGPLVSMYLAGLGLEIVKVEAVNRPDLIRFAGIPAGGKQAWERSATFIALNVGKRGITADLGDPAGREIVDRLLATADVVLDNFAPRTLTARGLDHAGLRAIRPDIVVTRMPGWGLTGTWAERPAYTQLVESTSGTASLTGREGEVPRITGTAFDPMSSMLGVFGTLAAIRHRQVTGEGGQVEVALCDSALQMTAQAMIHLTGGGAPLPRRGNRAEGLAPQGIYRCAGRGWIGLTIADDARWKALATVPGAPAWVTEDRFATVEQRTAAHDELDELVTAWTATRPAAELADALRAAGIAAAPLGVGSELIGHRQVAARGRVYAAPHPVVGRMTYLGPAARMSDLPELPERSAAPTLGGDNEAILAELGFTPEQIAGLAEQGAIGTVPYAKRP